MKSMTASSVVRITFVSLAAIVLVLAFHRRYWSDVHDPFKCSVLLNEGRWLDSPESKPWRRPWQIWQPPGCLLHEYKLQDLEHCSGSRQMLFAGDSNVRQLFWAVAKKLDHGGALQANKWSQKHESIKFERRGVNLRFIWDPFLNGSILGNELEIYQDNIASTGNAKRKQGLADPAVMMVIGGGLWHARHFEVGAVRQFKAAVDNIIRFTQRPDGSAWKSTAPFSGSEGIGDQVFLLPLEEPVYEKLSPSRKLAILPEEVDQMNDYLRKVEPSRGVNIPWVYQVMTSKRKWAYEESGFHVLESIANRRADILLNLRCNAKVDRAAGLPYERTCCSNYTNPNVIQVLFVAFAIVFLPLTTLWSANRLKRDVAGAAATVPASLMAVALALSYCFFADRTQLFGKVHKLYSQSEFLFLCGVVLVFGLCTIRKSKETLQRKHSNDVFVEPSQSFLSRDQSEEWKGWMQVIVLIYNWTGAHKELWIHIIVRLLVASYLFLAGYGHATYFYERGDYSIRRVASVLIRLNLLAVALSYQMYTNYLFYYYAPLASFWFLVVYSTFRFGRELNDNVAFLLGKIAISATVTALLHMGAEPINSIFQILRAIFRVNWNPDEWRQRVSLDGFIVYAGVLVALLHVWVRSVQSTPKSHRDNQLSSLLLTLFPFLRVAAVVAAIATPPVFIILTRRSPDTDDYDWWQPIISLLPILSYVVLRNCAALLRNHYSAGFAWLGRCSLETFTLQFHICMAADTNGVLSLGLANGDGTLRHDRWRDFTLLTPLFLWVSWQVSSASAVVTNWLTDAAPSDQTPVGLGKRDEGLPFAAKPASRRFAVDVGARFAALLGALWFLNLALG